MTNLMIWQILVPALAGLLLFLPVRTKFLKGAVCLLAAGVNAALSLALSGQDASMSLAFSFLGSDLGLRVYPFSGFILAAAGVLGFLFAVYTVVFMRDRQRPGPFLALFLISVAMINGAVLSDNLVLMLFFWEGLLVTIYAMIALNGGDAWKTAMKAFVIIGVTDLCLMAGIAVTSILAGTSVMSKISLSTGGAQNLAFVLLLIGALGKVGAVPFHTWIPDASQKAPLPFMAILPSSLEKLLGVYLLARICFDFFHLQPGCGLGIVMMTVGAVTILVTAVMTLVQKDMKRLLGYATVTQVGYILLGIGSCTPIGIVGGLFHTLNHAMYKSTLFLTAGAVERQAGTTEIAGLGGLWSKMPLTFACFAVTAAATLGLPPVNGFFSKELIFDAALETGKVFYLCGLAGALLTGLAFLRLGHAVFFGKPSTATANVKEAPALMLAPMLLISAGCLLFGLMPSLPLDRMIVPAVQGWLGTEHHSYSGFPANGLLVAASLVVIAFAVVFQLIAGRRNAAGSLDPVVKAPVIGGLYGLAERKAFDPYDLTARVGGWFARLLWGIDRVVDGLYDKVVTGLTLGLSTVLGRIHTGSYVASIVWALFAGVALVLVLVKLT